MFNLVPMPERLRRAGGVEFRLGRLLDHGVSTFDLTLTVGEHAEGLLNGLLFMSGNIFFSIPFSSPLTNFTSSALSPRWIPIGTPRFL